MERLGHGPTKAGWARDGYAVTIRTSATPPITARKTSSVVSIGPSAAAGCEVGKSGLRC